MKGHKIVEFLKKNGVKYDVIRHPTSYSAQMTAHAAHIPGREMAKCVIVRVMGKLVMVVTTANQKVNFRALRNLYGTEEVDLATENEFINAFRDCEPGAMPPFGTLYGMEELVSGDLAEDDEIVFNAGTHTELIKMKYADFEKLVHPRVVNFRISM